MSNLKKEVITCPYCLRGFFLICGHDEQDKDNTPEPPTEENTTGLTTYKIDSTLVDQQSTGRKRAAKLYPLNAQAYCEWSGKSDQGGGNHPIQGCGLRPNSQIGYQQCRHHGPDKNTLNNDLGNVHRICTPCHNEWHSKNDKDYVPGTVIGD
jgi:hypothetical protein